MKADSKTVASSPKESALYNMLLVESLIELLREKKVSDGRDIEERPKNPETRTKQRRRSR